MPLSLSATFRTANAWAAAAAVSLLFVIGLLATAPIATADTCANATVRAQTGSTGLPDCRAYEQVSAPYKEGFQIESFTVRFTDDGIASYGSFGSFAGNPLGVLVNSYLASRSATGWATASVAPPAQSYNTLQNNLDVNLSLTAMSADLRSQLWKAYRPDVPGDIFGLWLRGPDGSMTRIGDNEDPVLGPQAGVAGVSADLSHVVIYYGNGGTYFEHVGTGNGAPRTASVDNNGLVQGGCFNKISPDGRVIVYTTRCPVGSTPQVWARVAGSASVLVSGSECTRSPSEPGGACSAASGADYQGASVDGSRVFFTTSQQLVDDDTDTGQDLYACDIPAGRPDPVGVANPCATLTEVSGIATDARVERVISVSADGSRVYFVAHGGVLASNLGVGGLGAVAGVPNLYMWERDGGDPAGMTRFVTQLDTDDISRAQMTSDGRYLLFLTAKQLVTSGPGADTDNAQDAYRYDAVTKSMVRVSTSVSGAGGNVGNAGFDVSMTAQPASMTSQAASMSADGSTVIFDTAEPLSTDDTNGRGDVYAWRADRGVSLISAGGGSSMGITPSGRDIYFATEAQVLASDRDALTDIYDARAGGGFAPDQTPPSCFGDQCQGERSRAPDLAVPPPHPTAQEM